MDRFGRENNYWLGKKLSPKHCENIRLSRIGKKFSEASKLKMRLSHLGHKDSEETKLKKSLIHKGNKYCLGRSPWNKGIKDMHLSPKTEFKKGLVPWMKGKKHSPEIRLKISRAVMGKNVGEKNPAWRGGASFQEYPLGWRDTFKEQIRKRDGYKCQNCGCPEIECRSKLHVHHIDYDKQNIKEDNLISLCHSCHAKTVCKNRGYWTDYYKVKVCLEK